MDPKALSALIAMVVVFLAIYIPFHKRIHIVFPLLASCIAATLVAGFGVPVRYFVEGEFGFFYTVVVILSAVVFLQVIQDNGCLQSMIGTLARKLSRFPVLLLFVGMGLLYLPGMVTGLGVPGALGVGAILSPLFLSFGIPPASVAALITMGAMLGSVTGPVNIPAMIIAGGINMPFEGFGTILPVLTIPLGLVATGILGLKDTMKANPKTVAERFASRPEDVRPFRAFMPVVVVVVLLSAIRIFPKLIPDLGTPLVFAIGTAVAVVCGKKIDIWKTFMQVMDGPILNIVALLLASGVIVEVSTLTGIRGLLVVSSLSIPASLICVTAGVAHPLLGGTLTMLGSAAILGVPFATALLGSNMIVVVAALSLLCALSQFVPPTAIVGLLSKNLVGVERYGDVLRKLALPTVVSTLYGIFILIDANQVARFLGIQ
jgi:TRAP-type C4-dicarboxylate transport system permease large subunit